ncbi:MAG TPA: hypothetical protein VFV19_13835 [Candidatus Polarisedimenticolaceae bacterium]|nr:hypothetical protein [Candidatus Polarisedimenticolaceae bacterium]
MRPIPARLLLSTVMVGALVAGVLTSKPIFVVLALVAGVLLATSLATGRRPITRAIQRFRNQPVEVRIWGAPPPASSGDALIVSSVNALGAGVHVFFSAEGRARMHLKVAQPTELNVTSDSVVIGAARYVQWEGKKMSRADSAPAVAIVCTRAVPFPPAPH